MLNVIAINVLGKIQECMEKKGAYFHMIAWSTPLVLTITTMALGEIDGDSITGICFVGNTNRIYRVIFLLAPISAVLFTSAYFMSKGSFFFNRIFVDNYELTTFLCNTFRCVISLYYSNLFYSNYVFCASWVVY